MPGFWKFTWCLCSDPGRPKISSPVHLLLKVSDDCALILPFFFYIANRKKNREKWKETRKWVSYYCV